MSKLRQAAEAVADKLEVYAAELLKPAPVVVAPSKLNRCAEQLREALEYEQRELNDMTGRRYGDNVSLLSTFLAGLVANGEKRSDAHGTSLSLRDDLQRLASDDEFWMRQCQMAETILNVGKFPRYEDEPKETDSTTTAKLKGQIGQ